MRDGGDHRISFVDHDRLLQFEGSTCRILFRDADLEQWIHEGSRRTVPSGEFRAVDPDQGIVDAEARQCGHAMLDGLDRGFARLERRPPSSRNHVLYQCGDPNGWIQIDALEDDAMIDVGGFDRDVDGITEQEPEPFDFDRTAKRVLAHRGCWRRIFIASGLGVRFGIGLGSEHRSVDSIEGLGSNLNRRHGDR